MAGKFRYISICLIFWMKKEEQISNAEIFVCGWWMKKRSFKNTFGSFTKWSKNQFWSFCLLALLLSFNFQLTCELLTKEMRYHPHNLSAKLHGASTPRGGLAG